MRRPLLMTISVLAATSLLLVACSDDDDTSSPTTTEAPATTEAGTSDTTAGSSDAADTSDQTIVEIAAGNEDFSTLVAAVQAAGLDETLSGDGPYTVFAPTNEAFDKLPEGTLDDLLKPENKDQLTAILTYHVVAGEVMAADVMPGDVTTVNGATFEVSADGGAVTITDGQGTTANVTATDIVGSNGVIHVIDTVLLPPAS